MKYLLDTNIFIFILEEPASLSAAQAAIILDTANDLYISRATIYEMAIKVRIGSLKFSIPFEQVVNKARRQLKIKIIPEKVSHYERLSKLPKVRNHGDPFELLIMAQSVVEKMPVLTTDTKFKFYATVRPIF